LTVYTAVYVPLLEVGRAEALERKGQAELLSLLPGLRVGVLLDDGLEVPHDLLHVFLLDVAQLLFTQPQHD
jgi:hypothetical protein